MEIGFVHNISLKHMNHFRKDILKKPTKNLKVLKIFSVYEAFLMPEKDLEEGRYSK
jgi:hypothetical protein